MEAKLYAKQKGGKLSRYIIFPSRNQNNELEQSECLALRPEFFLANNSLSPPLPARRRFYFWVFHRALSGLALLLVFLLLFIPIVPVSAEEFAEPPAEEELQAATDALEEEVIILQSGENQLIGEMSASTTESSISGTSSSTIQDVVQEPPLLELEHSTSSIELVTEQESLIQDATSTEEITVGEIFAEENQPAEEGELNSTSTTHTGTGQTGLPSRQNETFVNSTSTSQEPTDQRQSTVGQELQNTDVSTSEATNDTAAMGSNQSREQMRREVEEELKRGCLELEDGSYYCISNNTGLAESNSNVVPIVGEVFTKEDDVEGDKEIYIQHSDRVIQVTHNNQEDIFPAQDMFGESLVWQSLINGRWQILFYDAATATTTQLTNTNFNNMNPYVRGDTVVWNAWVDGNWEIFLAKLRDAEQTQSTSASLSAGNTQNGRGWAIQQITDNTWHDMFPKIGGGLVTWQSFIDNSWQVFVYDLESKATSQISEGEGKFENPRIAVLWDKRGDDGGVKIFSHDLSTGKTTTIGKESRGNLPPEPLPEPPLRENKAAIPPSGTEGNSTTTPAKSGEETGE